jgi:hypothetical protein
MLTPEEFVSQWTEGRSRARPSDPLLSRLPFETQRFLVEGGLPPFDELALFFELDRGLSAVVSEGREYVRIGTDSASDVVVSPETGEVLSIPDTCFINSSVSHLAEFLLLVRDAARAPSRSDDEARTRLHALIAAMKRADARALATPGAWWSQVVADWLQQM